MLKLRENSTDHLYLQIAEGIESLINEEVIKIGDKLPSVRVLSEEYGISMGTAFQAYYHLEAKGLVEARAKSGYYVRFNKRRAWSLPEPQKELVTKSDVCTEQMIGMIFRSFSGDDLVNFAVAVPPTEWLPAAKLQKSIIHAMRTSPTGCLGYEEIQGNAELRKQVARLSFNWGGKLKADDIIITAGCMEALVMCLKSVTKAGDTVAIESPTYFGIFQVIQSLGLKVVEIPTDPVTGVDLNYLEEAIDKFNISACVFVTNFNNPLGCCMPDETKKALVELITRKKIPLIEDDIYGELYFGKQRPRTCKTFDKEGWVLQCASLSKSLAPGYRIGWAIPGRFTDEVLRTKMMHTITGTSVTQAAMAHFLGIGRYEYHLKNLRRRLHTQYLRYLQAILEYFPSNIKVSRPQGGFVLWIELDKSIDAFQLYQEAIKQHVSIAPGQIFSARGSYRHCLRIGYGRAWDDKTEKGIKTIGNLVRKLEGRSGQ